MREEAVEPVWDIPSVRRLLSQCYNAVNWVIYGGAAWFPVMLRAHKPTFTALYTHTEQRSCVIKE